MRRITAIMMQRAGAPVGQNYKELFIQVNFENTNFLIKKINKNCVPISLSVFS